MMAMSRVLLLVAVVAATSASAARVSSVCNKNSCFLKDAPCYKEAKNSGRMHCQHANGRNKITGTIPMTGWHDFRQLTDLRLTGNLIRGTIPRDMIEQLTNLEYLYLSRNNMEGTIPYNFTKLTKLKVLKLDGNDFSGKLPWRLGDGELGIKGLEILDVSDNKLVGTIPPEMKDLKKLREFNAYGNDMCGDVPNGLPTTNGGQGLSKQTCGELGSPQCACSCGNDDSKYWSDQGEAPKCAKHAQRTYELRLEPVMFKGGYNMMMRSYNGEYPAPTVRARRGDTVRITIYNDLHGMKGNAQAGYGEGNPDYGYEMHNKYSAPNVTNLHTHGLHISPNEPSDNVFVRIEPGESYSYIFEIPDYHLGGTHWYHPHHHGSTSIQVAHGGHGFFIIEDEPGDLPYVIATMEQRLVLLSHHFEAFYAGIANNCKDNLYQDPLDDPNGMIKDNYVSITVEDQSGNREVKSDFYDNPRPAQMNSDKDGIHIPSIKMQQGKYYRLRFLNSGWTYTSGLRLHLEDPYEGNCELKLLAKDGVYLPNYPRDLGDEGEMILNPGARADVAVRCRSAGRFTIASRSAIGSYGFVGRIFELDVQSSGAADSPLLEKEYYQKDYYLPWYLADLRDNPANGVHYGPNPQKRADPIEIPEGNRFAVNLVAQGGVDSMASTFYFNGDQWRTKGNYLKTMSEGQPQDWELEGINQHPFHIHVNHFQIQEIYNPIPDVTIADNIWFQPGDWHDTMMTLQDPNIYNKVRVRFHTERFGGPVIMHCHILPHEDRGMMGVACIRNEQVEGWDTDCLIDCPNLQQPGYATPTPYDPNYPDAPPPPAGNPTTGACMQYCEATFQGNSYAEQDKRYRCFDHCYATCGYDMSHGKAKPASTKVSAFSNCTSVPPTHNIDCMDKCESIEDAEARYECLDSCSYVCPDV